MYCKHCCKQLPQVLRRLRAWFMAGMHIGQLCRTQHSVFPGLHRFLAAWVQQVLLVRSAEKLAPATRAAHPTCNTAFMSVCSTRAAPAAGDGKDLQIDPATLDRVTKAMLSRSKVLLLTNADRQEAR